MRHLLLALLSIPLIWTAFGCAPRPVAEPSVQESVRRFTKWESVRDAEHAAASFTPKGIAGLGARRNQEWLYLAALACPLPLHEKLARINEFFNQWPYTEDAAEDHWATPREFVQNSGDCEDYAITKYYALRFLGIPPEQLRIAAVWNARKKEGHALLAVITSTEGGMETLLLDCVTDEILTWKTARHYHPVFYMNEDFLWRFPQD